MQANRIVESRLWCEDPISQGEDTVKPPEIGERARDRHPLRLATGQQRSHRVLAVADFQIIERLDRTR